MIASKILQYFARLYWLAVVGEGASAPGVVCAGYHGFGSCGLLAENPAPGCGLLLAFGIGFALVGHGVVGGCCHHQ